VKNKYVCSVFVCRWQNYCESVGFRSRFSSNYIFCVHGRVSIDIHLLAPSLLLSSRASQVRVYDILWSGKGLREDARLLAKRPPYIATYVAPLSPSDQICLHALEKRRYSSVIIRSSSYSMQVVAFGRISAPESLFNCLHDCTATVISAQLSSFGLYNFEHHSFLGKFRLPYLKIFALQCRKLFPSRKNIASFPH
jgi:hypothetical protein